MSTEMIPAKKIIVSNFIFNNKQVRCFLLNEKIWFIVKDIADALNINNIRMSITTIDRNELSSISPSMLFKKPNVSSTYIDEFNLEVIDEAGHGGKNLTIITEEGLYSLILKSRSTAAKEFKQRLANEFLPAVRRSVQITVRRVPTTFAEALRLAADLEDEKNAIAKQLELAQPKVKFAEACEGAKNSVSIGTFAKFLNEHGYVTGQNRFFQTLINDKLLMRRHGNYEPTQKAAELKLFTLTEKYVEKINIVRITARITQKGQQYLFKKYTGNEISEFAIEDSNTAKEINNEEIKEITQTSLFNEEDA